MLVLTRRIGESIQIGDQITVTVVRVGPNEVRVGIDAPPDVTVFREELSTDAPRPPSPLGARVQAKTQSHRR